MFVLLRPPTNGDEGNVGRGCTVDVGDGDFSLKEELKVLCNGCLGRLQGPGNDAFVVGFGGLAPLQGSESGVSSQDNPVENGAVWVGRW